MSPFDTLQIAEVAHGANRALRRALGEETKLGRGRAWALLDTAFKQRLADGVDQQRLEPVSPEVCHERWMAAMQNSGWVHGETQDLIMMTHPNLLPWDELPEEQRAKDRLFIAIIAALSPQP